jgi:hypothetical protein
LQAKPENFVACAALEFLAASKSMVAQRFPKDFSLRKANPDDSITADIVNFAVYHNAG